MFALSSCSNDDSEDNSQTESEEYTGKLSDLELLENRLVETDSVGNILGYLVGANLNEADPTEISVPVNTYEEAVELFKKWLKIEMRECEDMPNQEEGATRKREAFMHVIMSVSDLTEKKHVAEMLTLWVDSYIKQCVPVPGDDIDLDIARVCNEHHMYKKEIEL